jgi:hypothetical protein
VVYHRATLRWLPEETQSMNANELCFGITPVHGNRDFGIAVPFLSHAAFQR